MKLIFFPMLLFIIIEIWYLKDTYPSITCGMYSDLLIGTFLIPTIFYTYSEILGKNYTVLDIGTFVISVLLAFIYGYKITLRDNCKKRESYIVAFAIIMFLLFLVFTIITPNLGIFKEP